MTSTKLRSFLLGEALKLMLYLKNDMAKKTKTQASKAENLETPNFLNQLLADEQILLLKTRRAHWNVEGPDFYSMHQFFEAQYNELNELIDEIAERTRQIGHYAVGSFDEYLSLTHLTEKSIEGTESKHFISELAMDHKAIIVYLKSIVDEVESLDDPGSHDFLIAVLQAHEKMYWMLNAHLR